MAIDDAEKRRSAAGIPIGPGVTPNASQDAQWRAQVAWGYSGILAGEQVEEDEDVGGGNFWAARKLDLILIAKARRRKVKRLRRAAAKKEREILHKAREADRVAQAKPKPKRRPPEPEAAPAAPRPRPSAPPTPARVPEPAAAIAPPPPMLAMEALLSQLQQTYAQIQALEQPVASDEDAVIEILLLAA